MQNVGGNFFGHNKLSQLTLKLTILILFSTITIISAYSQSENCEMIFVKTRQFCKWTPNKYEKEVASNKVRIYLDYYPIGNKKITDFVIHDNWATSCNFIDDIQGKTIILLLSSKIVDTIKPYNSYFKVYFSTTKDSVYKVEKYLPEKNSQAVTNFLKKSNLNVVINENYIFSDIVSFVCNTMTNTQETNPSSTLCAKQEYVFYNSTSVAKNSLGEIYYLIHCYDPKIGARENWCFDNISFLINWTKQQLVFTAVSLGN